MPALWIMSSSQLAPIPVVGRPWGQRLSSPASGRSIPVHAARLVALDAEPAQALDQLGVGDA